MNPLQREKFEAWLVICGFYSMLLGCVALVLWANYR